MQEDIQRLTDIAADPYAYARQWKAETGGKVVATLCSYAPEELILAAGLLGLRIVGGGGRISRADRHLQSYCCSLVRGALEAALSGDLDFLDGAIFPHTCDSIQRLSDVWRINAGIGFHLDVVWPVKLDTPSARQYAVAVLHKARTDLETALGYPIDDDALARAIDTLNAIRSAMQRIYSLRGKRPGILAGSAWHTIIRASMVMDRNDFLDVLTRIADGLETAPEPAAAGRRIFLSGGVCNLPDIYGIIEAAGGTVVGDDLCTGHRGLTGLVETGDTPIDAIADRYLARAICPAKHAGVTRRGEELIRMVKEAGAEGVIFLHLKFCDPHAFDYPYLKKTLDANGIPCLLVELEEQSISQGQFQTRCEAFMEML
jgi:benzoyl-CoA reductase subunit C